MRQLVAQRRAVYTPWSGSMPGLRLADVGALLFLTSARSGGELVDAGMPQDAVTRVVARRWAALTDAPEPDDLVVTWAKAGWLRPRMFLERAYQEKARHAAESPATPLDRSPIFTDYASVRRGLARASSYSFQPRAVPRSMLARLGELWAHELEAMPQLSMRLVVWAPDEEPTAHRIVAAPDHLGEPERHVPLAALVELAQGQRWAVSGAGGVLFVCAGQDRLTAAGERGASNYLECLLHSGRIGQRTVLLLEQLGLRGRMTPALDEELACAALGLIDAEPLYLLRFGFPTSLDR